MGCSSEKNLGSVLDLFIFGSLIWGLQRLTIYAGSSRVVQRPQGMLIGLSGTGIHPALMQSRLLRLLQHWPAAVVLRATDNWGEVEHPTNSIHIIILASTTRIRRRASVCKLPGLKPFFKEAVPIGVLLLSGWYQGQGMTDSLVVLTCSSTRLVTLHM